MKALLPVALLLAAALAGCTADRDAVPAPPVPLLERTAANVPELRLDATAAADWWSDFARTYTLRHPYTQGNLAARDHIAATLHGAGFAVKVLQYPAGVGTPARASAPQAEGPLAVNVVVAERRGATDAGHAIALGAHYDSSGPYPSLVGRAPGTVEGAYDNASGVAVAVAACEALAKVPMRRTLLCLFFDGEETGTVGSRAFQADLARGNLTLDAYLGFDMVGLNWPALDPTQPGMGDWKLYAWTGEEFADALFPFVNGTLHQVLGYPPFGAQAFPSNDRRSDEASFAQAHVPTVRFGGGRYASTYPQYHMPGDTVDYVEAFAGGRDRLEMGMAAVIKAAWQLTLQLDQVTLDDLRAAAR